MSAPHGYAVIDTETSGLFDFSKPADAPGQPRLAELAVVLLDGDLGLISTHDYKVIPEGWTMDARATVVNGLTDDILRSEGHPVRDVLRYYDNLITSGYVIVAHNTQYDTKVMRGEMRRAGMDDRFEQTPNICTMRSAVDVCKIPSANGRSFKFPKLSELARHFGLPFPKEHTALGDAVIATEAFRKLMAMKACPAPKVYFAKNRPVAAPPPSDPATPHAMVTPQPLFSTKWEREDYEREQRGEKPLGPLGLGLLGLGLPAVGHNNPPGAIESAEDAFRAISDLLARIPAITTQEAAAEAKTFLDRAKAELAALEAAKDAEAGPLYRQWQAMLDVYRGPIERLTALRKELGNRLKAYLDEIEASRIAEANRRRWEAEEASLKARAALDAEAEAKADAAQGVFTDVGAAVKQADAAILAAKKTDQQAKVAERDAANVRLSGGFGKAISVRSRPVPVVEDAVKAVGAMWPDESLKQAILTAARAYKKRTGEWPAGIGEAEERSL